MKIDFVFKVKLKGISKPPVWRRIVVPDDYTFYQFHEIIQEAFGWYNYHLFEFCEFLYQDEGIHISLLSENDMYSGRKNIVDAEEMELYEWFDEDNPKLLYNYDFGDDWLHEIVLEEILEDSDSESPKCIAGKGACPPEDCGGPYGYERIKYVLESNEAPKEAANIRKWLGLKKDELLDIKYFDIDDANERIKAL